MKKYINFYFDESGNCKSEFFAIGGFYILNNNQKDESKIIRTILKTEKSIKKYTKNHNSNKYDNREIKWNNLSFNSKEFLFKNIKNYGQNNMSIISNLKKWKSNNKQINLNAIYNLMIYYLIERTINKINWDYDDEIIIKISVDQRKDIPKISKGCKLVGLEEYLETQFYFNSNFNKIKIKVVQYNSKINPLIRYADYYAGLIASMCRFLANHKRKWDENIDLIFKTIHQKINCICYNTIKSQCEIINKLCNICSLFMLT